MKDPLPGPHAPRPAPALDLGGLDLAGLLKERDRVIGRSDLCNPPITRVVPLVSVGSGPGTDTASSATVWDGRSDDAVEAGPCIMAQFYGSAPD